MSIIQQLAAQLGKQLNTEVAVTHERQPDGPARYYVTFPEKSLWPVQRFPLGTNPIAAKRALALLCDVLAWTAAERDADRDEKTTRALKDWVERPYG